MPASLRANLSTDRNTRRRPFTSLMRRLANLKNSSEPSSHGGPRAKKGVNGKNNPYPLLGQPLQSPPDGPSGRGHLSFSTPPSRHSLRGESPSQSRASLPISHDGSQFPPGNKSVAPTVSTNPGTTHSDAAQSKAGTATTGAGTAASAKAGGDGSTFSSPTPSVRSLTTTLTTVQSAAPATLMAGSAQPTPPATSAQPGAGAGAGPAHPTFTHSPPASAIPPHVMGTASATPNPSSYTAATANNLLTDNASILTLASSSKRRRRNSLDTNASVRALAPSSLFGGSRESLPLSVLSAPGDAGGLAAVHNRSSVGGLPAAERASVYSSGAGAAPALSSERNSYYATKQGADGASVRSGLIGHGRNDSITGSITGTANAWPTPREQPVAANRSSRRNSSGRVDQSEEEGEAKGKGKEKL